MNPAPAAPSPAAILAAGHASAPLRILFASSEVAPFAKTGGLADVVGALPRALAARGHECAVIMPLYRCTRVAGPEIERTEVEFVIPVGGRRVPGRLWKSHLPKSAVPVYLVEQPDFFERDDLARGIGLYQYKLPDGRLRDYPDNAQRFIFFSRAVLEAVRAIDLDPDVIHCNDWQTGLIPVYLRETEPYRTDLGAVQTLLTIHNLAYQGVFWHWDMLQAGLEWRLFNFQQLEFYGHLNFLKGGIVYADALNTVSRRYAEEIQTKEYGCALEDVLRFHRRKLTGIMNGVDYAEWNPATDRHLTTTYNAESVLEGKAACKAAVQRSCGLADMPNIPLLAVIARLVEQKVGLLGGIADALLKEDVQLIVLGLGDPAYHSLLERMRLRHPWKTAVRFEFSEALAHQIEAGADLFLMPSQFEPSGLNQLYSLKYGTPPVVRDTGGLHDTVTDCTPETLGDGTATGFTFQEYQSAAFLAAIRRALDLYHTRPDQWRRLIRNGMSQDWSWNHSAAEYEKLYQQLRSQGSGVGSQESHTPLTPDP